jgi:RimJ/RimL family protein N-acetyltransferase
MYARRVLIETQRLRLRPIELHDLDEFVELHADPEVTQFIRPLDHAAAEERTEVLAQFDETELGWALRREAWGQGYATEAARTCIEWEFSEFDMPYLTAMIGPGNVRSVRVAERLGLTPLREDVLLDDPVVVYGLDRVTAE